MGLSRGEQALLLALEKNSGDDQARFGLGILQFTRAVERFGQSLHQYGARADNTRVPFLRVPVPKNDNPHAIRQHVADFGDGTYGVHLGNNFYRVDNDLPVASASATSPAYAGLGREGSMWAAVIEKAYADSFPVALLIGRRPLAPAN